MAENLTINVLSGDRKIDALMHNADLYEPFKRHAEVWSIAVTCVPIAVGSAYKTAVMRLASLRMIVDGMAMELVPDQIVTAVWVAQYPWINHVDWSVRVVSDGHRFAVLADYLAKFGIYGKS